MSRKVRTARRNFEGAVAVYKRSPGNRFLKAVVNKLAAEYGELLRRLVDVENAARFEGRMVI